MDDHAGWGRYVFAGLSSVMFSLSRSSLGFSYSGSEIPALSSTLLLAIYAWHTQRNPGEWWNKQTNKLTIQPEIFSLWFLSQKWSVWMFGEYSQPSEETLLGARCLQRGHYEHLWGCSAVFWLQLGRALTLSGWKYMWRCNFSPSRSLVLLGASMDNPWGCLSWVPLRFCAPWASCTSPSS